MGKYTYIDELIVKHGAYAQITLDAIDELLVYEERVKGRSFDEIVEKAIAEDKHWEDFFVEELGLTP